MHRRAAVLHGVEARPRRSHHPRVETHPWTGTAAVKHHAVHLRLPGELGGHPLAGHPLGVGGWDGGVGCWCLLRGGFCCVGAGGASLLRRSLGVGLVWDAVHAVDLVIYAPSAFLCVRYPYTRERRGEN